MTSLDGAYASIDRWIREALERASLPGWAIAVTDRDNLLWQSTHGFANAGAQDPVVADSIFQIGSIGKSFTAIALLQQRDEGKLDLHAQVEQYLPWFRVRSKHQPITVHHLLRHTAGLIRGTEQAPYGLYDAWVLRELEVGGPPGEHWHYSSVGYKVLGFLLEQLTGETYPEAVKSRILDPLGMTRTYPAVTFDVRKISTVGYRCFYDDRPEHHSHGVAPALWSEYSTADGCQVSTAADMAVYVRMLLNRGMGPRGRIISEESFELLTQPEVSAGNDYYAYSMALYPQDGHTYIGHGGATTGYMTCMMFDLEEGLGVVSLVNKMGETNAVEALTIRALTALRAANHGREIPAFPAEADPTAISDAADFAGAYRCGDKSLELAAEDGKLLLRWDGTEVALERRGEDIFYVAHPDFHLFLLEFKREGGWVVEAFHGSQWYVNNHYSGPTRFNYPQKWEAYPGHYRARNPELSNFRVILRKGALALVFPWCRVAPLTPLDDNLFRIEEDDSSPETLRFDAVVDGQALRADYSGCPYYRAFTP